MNPFISICIPAYQRVNYLRRLLDSITGQTFNDFEIIITDDSKDDSVKELVELYENKMSIVYHKNKHQLGTPENWNEGIRKAKGEWIKIMHDDDWFSNDKSLQKFVEHSNPNNKFIFSAYRNVFEQTNRSPEMVHMPNTWEKKIISEPNILLARNVIGPPSVTLVHSSMNLNYDKRLKWRVDMEYYIRVLQKEKKLVYINELLVNVGISESQVTQSCIYEPSVELPEGFILLQKHGVKALKNIWVYDAWWRLLRNMQINNVETLEKYVPEKWPTVIEKIVKDLSLVSPLLLKNGVTSKTLMSISYFKNYSSIK